MKCKRYYWPHKWWQLSFFNSLIGIFMRSIIEVLILGNRLLMLSICKKLIRQLIRSRFLHWWPLSKHRVPLHHSISRDRGGLAVTCMRLALILALLRAIRVERSLRHLIVVFHWWGQTSHALSMILWMVSSHWRRTNYTALRLIDTTTWSFNALLGLLVASLALIFCILLCVRRPTMASDTHKISSWTTHTFRKEGRCRHTRRIRMMKLSRMV